MNEEQLLKDRINRDRENLHKLKGKQIKLCGYCYHRDEGNWEEHSKNSKGCHRNAYPCPTKVYARGVTFFKDGRANIDWSAQ